MDSGASYHLVCESSLTDRERLAIYNSDKPITLSTAGEPIFCNRMVKVYVPTLELALEAYVGPGEHQPLIGINKLCRDHGFGFVVDGTDNSKLVPQVALTEFNGPMATPSNFELDASAPVVEVRRKDILIGGKRPKANVGQKSTPLETAVNRLDDKQNVSSLVWNCLMEF